MEIKTSGRPITHGKSNTRWMNIWLWIRQRCNNSKSDSYKNYWWRWIKCLWKNFEEFYEDMKEWYSDELSIDRINNNWNYCKENCRRATARQQANNRRKSIHVSIRKVMQLSKKDIKYYINSSKRIMHYSIYKQVYLIRKEVMLYTKRLFNMVYVIIILVKLINYLYFNYYVMKAKEFFTRVGRNKRTAQIGKKKRYFTQEEVNLCNRELKTIFN